MRLLRILPLAGLAALILSVLPISAQITTARTRIVDRIDESQLTRLSGNTHPFAKAKYDTGRVSADLPMTDLILVLSRSAEQQAALDAYTASLYDAHSPNYHHWLSAAQLGENFGPSLADITTLSGWLAGKGFSVDQIAPDRMTIRFSGTAGIVETAFHVEMHNLLINGQAHIANMSDPQIPAALAPAVVGVKSLHNFFPKPQHQVGHLVERDSATGKWKRVESAITTTASTATPAKVIPAGAKEFRGLYGYSYDGSEYEDVTPYDFAAIYNVTPLWSAGIDGSGQTIAIAGTSAIRPADVSTFRTDFGLPTNTVNVPIQVSGHDGSSNYTVCTGSGTSTPYSSNYCNIDDQLENALDVEWSGSVAKNAQIVLVSSYPNSATDDTLYDSESYIVNNNSVSGTSVYGVHVMNVSYGECELGNGTAGNVEYRNLWQTAANEGLAVFVSSGDTGSASCDAGDSSSTPALYGTNVSGMASTPFNTAVGGTDLNWGYWNTVDSHATYWNSTNASNQSNAMGYIPEVPWNGTCTNPLIVGYLNTSLGSNLSATTMCDDIFTNYVYSSSTSGEQWLDSLLVPEGGSGGISNCVANDTTSASTTLDTTSCGSQTTTGSANGSLTLYNDGWPKPSWQTGVTGIPTDGVRDLPDVSFFASNGVNGSSYLVCLSDEQACSSVSDFLEIGGTSASSPAMAGVMALINQKAGAGQGLPNAQLYALAAKQTYSSCSAENTTSSSSCYFNDIDTGTIAMPCDYLDKTPNCTGSDYVGVLTGYSSTVGYDLATGLGSLNVANVVNAWVSDAGTTASKVAVTANPSTAITINQSVIIYGTVASNASGTTTTPTGTVSLSGGGYTASQSLSGGAYSFTVPANSLTAGADMMTVTYEGDATFSSSSNSTSVTVNVMTATVGVSASNGNIANAMNVSVTVSGPAGSTATPSGTVSLKGGGYSSAAVTLSGGTATIPIPANSLTAGNDTLTVTYSGDSNFASNTGSTTVTMSQTTTLTPSVTVTPGAASIDSGQSLSVTVTVTGSGATPTGSVILTSGSFTSTVAANGGTLNSSGVGTVLIPANSLNSSSGGSSDTLKATYSGDTNYAQGYSGTSTVTVTSSAYAVNLSSTSATVTPGGSATSTISLSSSTYYTASTITLSCSVTTSLASYSYAPTCTATPNLAMSAGTASSNPTTATLTINTTAATSSMVDPSTKGGGWMGLGSGAVLALLFFISVPRGRRGWKSIVSVLLLAIAFGVCTGCGSGSSGSGGSTGIAGTTAGAYTVTVTATGNDSGSTMETNTFTLTVN